MLNRNVRLINFYTICCNVVFVLPVIVLYYQTIGLTFRDFLLGEAFFSAVVLLAEVPTGWISDTWKRRSALILGLTFGMAGYAGLILADSFIEAMISQGILGIAVAMNSGTVTALLYDTLQEQGRGEDYRRLDGKRHAVSLYSVAVTSLLGAFLFKIDPKLPLVADMFALLAAMIAISFVIEPVRHMAAVTKHPLRDMAHTMRYALRGHPEITGIILVSAVIFSATKLMMWSQQPYFALTGVPVEYFGMILSGSYLLGGAVGHWSHRIEHIGSNRAVLGFMAGMMAAACLVMALVPSFLLAIPLFLTGTLTYAMGQPRVNNAINTRVGSERRATILSTASLMVHVLAIPTTVIVGVLSQYGSVLTGLFYIAGQIIVLGGIGLWLWKKPINQVPA